MTFLSTFRLLNIFVDNFVPIWQVICPNIAIMLFKVLSIILNLSVSFIQFSIYTKDLLNGRSLTEGLFHMGWLILIFVLVGIWSKISRWDWTKTIMLYALVIIMIEKIVDESLQTLPFCCIVFLTATNLLIAIFQLYCCCVGKHIVTTPPRQMTVAEENV
jgi:hypothetical protein